MTDFACRLFQASVCNGDLSFAVGVSGKGLESFG